MRESICYFSLLQDKAEQRTYHFCQFYDHAEHLSFLSLTWQGREPTIFVTFMTKQSIFLFSLRQGRAPDFSIWMGKQRTNQRTKLCIFFKNPNREIWNKDENFEDLGSNLFNLFLSLFFVCLIEADNVERLRFPSHWFSVFDKTISFYLSIFSRQGRVPRLFL